MTIPSEIQSLIKPGLGMRLIPEISEFDWDYWNGRMLVWEPPEKGETYALGVDPAEGVGADRSVCEVIKVGNLKHPDIQVAEFACDFLDPVDFASVVSTIGNFYKDSHGEEALCTLEINAPCGQSAIQILQGKLGYSNLFIWKRYDRIYNQMTNAYGWWTNKTTRPMVIARGLHAFGYGDLIVNSSFLLGEMQDFERDHFMAKASAKRGKHDDRLMALLIGYWGAHDDEWMAGEDVAEERRLVESGTQIRAEIVKKTLQPRADYWNQPLSYEKMMELAEENLFNED